jgi:integral membrane protein
MRDPVLRWRVLAWTVGVGLLVLLFVAMPLKYLADSPGTIAVVGPTHGFLFALYALLTLDLGRRRRWTPPRMLLTILAGTIPLLSFVIERRVTHEVRDERVVA